MTVGEAIAVLQSLPQDAVLCMDPNTFDGDAPTGPYLVEKIEALDGTYMGIAFWPNAPRVVAVR